MKPITVIVLCFTAVVGCTKTKDDISGNSTLAGRVYIENPYDAQPAKLLSGQEIQVFGDTSANAGNFIRSTKSDQDGNFSFDFLYGDRKYLIRAEKKDTTRLDRDILYAASTVLLPKGDVKFVLTPDTITQNALLITCVDELPIPGRIPKDSIKVYTSRVLATFDSAAISGAGASYIFTAGDNGIAFKMNLPADSLFINAAVTIGGKRFKSKLTGIKIKPPIVERVTIVMQAQ